MQAFLHSSTTCTTAPKSIHHPCQLDPALTTSLQLFQWLGVAPSTRRTYQVGIGRYLQFCESYHLQPFPGSPLTLRYFAAYLAHSVKHSTIKIYLSAIRLRHLELGFSNPTEDTLLYYVIKGIKRSQGEIRHPRLPITTSILCQLKTQLHHCSEPQYHDKCMLWAAFCLAFYGFLRSSEFVSPVPHSFDPSTTLLCRNITILPTTILVTLKSSKTDPFRKGCTLYIGSTGISTCPISAMQKYTSLTSNAPQKPLFHFSDGSYLTRTVLTTKIRTLLTAAGHQASSFSSHSFCIGVASTATNVGLPDWLIQTFGRWSSNCFTTYIHTDPSVLANASKQLATSRQ